MCVAAGVDERAGFGINGFAGLREFEVEGTSCVLGMAGIGRWYREDARRIRTEMEGWGRGEEVVVDGCADREWEIEEGEDGSLVVWT